MTFRSLNRLLLLTMALLHLVRSGAQDSASTKREYVSFKGYLKNLHIANVMRTDSILTYEFIHNRLNFRLYPSNCISAAVEIRNRVYYGQLVQLIPGFGNFVDSNNESVKLSRLFVNNNSVIVHSIIDRLWVAWTFGKWEVKAGRQRINWGKSVVWNPNDLFNTFNFANFDYEEQPGSDAIRVSYYPTGMSAIEVACRPGVRKDETVAAAIWKFNRKTFDIQVLGGLYYTDLALGTGWAGNLGNAGIKGEATLFAPKNKPDSLWTVSATASIDYSFRKPLYVHGGLLYINHRQQTSAAVFNFTQAFNNVLSAKNLMPSDWSIFGQLSYNFTPLLRADVSVIYGIDPDFIFGMPSLSYSISESWDLTLLDQLVAIQNGNNYHIVNSIYLRLKWSF